MKAVLLVAILSAWDSTYVKTNQIAAYDNKLECENKAYFLNQQHHANHNYFCAGEIRK